MYICSTKETPPKIPVFYIVFYPWNAIFGGMFLNINLAGFIVKTWQPRAARPSACARPRPRTQQQSIKFRPGFRDIKHTLSERITRKLNTGKK